MNLPTTKPLPADLIAWLEARGYAVDRKSGRATRRRPRQAPSLPYIWGAQDACSGMACVPEQFFVTRADQRDYAAGWASIAGHNETTHYFLGQ